MNQQKESAFGKGLYPASAVFLLESPLRKLIKSPKKVADRLSLQTWQQVIELGAGSGYYSQDVANRLPLGRLVLVDIQPGMLFRAKHSLEAAGLENVESILADATVLPVVSEQFDTAFMVTVLGEVSDKAGVIMEIYRVLRAGGLLSIGEQRTDPDFVSLEEVKQLTKQAGFVFDRYFGNRWNFTANFIKQ